jgi:PAS domain S-box-containing protein
VIEQTRSLISGWRHELEGSIYDVEERLTAAGRQVRAFLAFGSGLAALLLVVGGVALWRGLRAREQTERDLARLANVVATSDDAIISESLDGRILTWNKGAQQIYGFAAEEAVGRQLYDIVPVTHQKEVKEMRTRVSGGERLRHFRTKRLTRDGRLLDISLTVSPLYDRAGRIIGISTISRDITEQKRLEEEVRQAIEIKSRFISIASHELRSPLTAIREGIALIVEEARGPVTPGQKELLEVALRNIDRLARLSTDILDFQKSESGSLRLVRAWHDLRDIFDDVVKTVRPVADEKKLALTLDIAADLTPIVCDKDKVTQVLINIVGNAVKFTQAGSVHIEARREPDAVHVAVRDTGCGIAGSDMRRLFGSFQQFGAAKTQGSGLGLFIARQIVRAHGGRIWAESEPGRGSVFYLTLPLQ